MSRHLTQIASEERPALTSGSATHDRLHQGENWHSIEASDPKRPGEIPTFARILLALVAVLATWLLVQAAIRYPNIWRVQTVSEISIGSLLLVTAVSGICGVHQSSLICTVSAILGWCVALSSLLLEHALKGPVPAIGLAIFCLAGLASDALADRRQVWAPGRDDTPNARAEIDLAIIRFSAGI